MLTQLHIENIAVIEKADIEFGKGLTVLTGETGAGKSIIVDSLGAVRGARTSRELVRTGAEYGVVSAVFETDAAAKWFEDNDFEPEDEVIIPPQDLRRRQKQLPRTAETRLPFRS